MWDLATGKAVKSFGPLPDAVKSVAFNRDSSRIGAAAGKTLMVWNLADGKEVLTLAHPAAVIGLSFSADQTKIVTAATDNVARVWDVATRQEMAESRGGAVRSFCWTTGMAGLNTDAMPQLLPTPVSTPCSSNRTGGFPASGSRTRNHAFAHVKVRRFAQSRTSPSTS